ncbi:MAG TPA: hypothetical protein VNC79_00025 [Mycobacteriales bacterium]|nr:hypothetical protein [Mycobacteriales bacterium]
MHIDDSRRERLSILTAMESALADPVGMIRILLDCADDEDAIGRLSQEFALDEVQAQSVLDLQVRRVTAANRARIAEELRVLRAEWGPPLEAQVRFTGRRSAVLSIDGAEHSFRAGGVNGVLEKIGAFVLEEIAVPRLRPVAATVSGLPDGPVRMTYTPARSGHFEYPDDPIASAGEG